MKIFAIILVLCGLTMTVRSNVAVCELVDNSVRCLPDVDPNASLENILKAYRSSGTGIYNGIVQRTRKGKDSFAPFLVFETGDSTKIPAEIKKMVEGHLEEICSDHGWAGFFAGISMTLLVVAIIGTCVNRKSKREKRIPTGTELNAI